MTEESKRVRCRITCPEGKGETRLLLHWWGKNDKETLNSIQCDNAYLKDLGGGDCKWSCWDKVSERK